MLGTLGLQLDEEVDLVDEQVRVMAHVLDLDDIGVGGGALLDTAKALARRLGLPFVAAPTIAATCASAPASQFLMTEWVIEWAAPVSANAVPPAPTGEVTVVPNNAW